MSIFHCESCEKSFTTKRALAAHANRVHGRINEVSDALQGTVLACMTNFHWRQRALQHLLCGKRRCLTAIREKKPPVSGERIAEILEDDRVERRRARNNPGSRTESDLPALRHAGPLRSWGITVSRWA